MITHQINSSDKELIITFHSDAISTTAEKLQVALDEVIETSSVWNADWDQLTLDMRQMRMIDSLGLNILVMLIKRAEGKDASVLGRIKSRIIYQTLLATRIDRMMKLSLEE